MASPSVSTGGWPEAVIFDFDGLLMDTESTSFESWRYEWEQWGLTLDSDGFFAEHGGDITEKRYEDLAAAVGRTFDREASHERRMTFRDGLHADLGLRPGVHQWVTEARSLGISTAVASSSPTPWVVDHLSRVGAVGDFDVFACGDEVSLPKPAPDVYQLALERLGIDGSSALAVEDTPHGIDAAKAAGLRACAIPNPHASHARCSHADLILTSAAEMPLSQALSHLA
jgi:HAD superfamily hydrolase (TIGR01509 family)